MCKSILKGQNVPRDRRDISRDRWDVSPGQTGRTPEGVPPKLFMFIGFFLSPFLNHTPNTAGTFRKKFRKDPGKRSQFGESKRELTKGGLSPNFLEKIR